MLHKLKKHIKSRDYYRVLFLRTVGNFLILSALFMIGKTFYQPVREEAKFMVENLLNKKYVLAGSKDAKDSATTENQGGLSRLLNLKKVEILSPQDTQYSIVIPKIGANSRIIPNVNAANESEYLGSLKQGVAQTLGTANPGEGGHIFLFAHSADNIFDIGTYNAVFYLLYKLEKEDEVNIFYQNRRYTYRVIDKKVVDPSEVEYLTRKTDSEFLTLQTCYPPGTTLKRLLVFAVPKEK
ncbi:MAG: sortase [Patescibacteria group bacterium]